MSPTGTISGTITFTANEQGPAPPATTFSNPLVGTQTAHGGQTLTATAPFTLLGVTLHLCDER